MPIMLQQSFELLTGKRLGLLRFSLALGYVVMSWKHIRVVFITKPGKHMSQAKSLSPVSLTSFVLKIFEKLLDRHIRGVFWYQNHFILTNLPIGQVRLQKQLSSWWFLDWKIFEVYGDCLGYLPGFWRGIWQYHFWCNNYGCKRLWTWGTCCRWIRSMLESRLVHTSLMGSILTARVAGGCPQEGVLSPLLWNLVVDKLLAVENDPDFSSFGYTKDIVIIVQGKYSHNIREIIQEALNVLVKWANKEGPNISPNKTAIIPFTNRRKFGDDLSNLMVRYSKCGVRLSIWEWF